MLQNILMLLFTQDSGSKLFLLKVQILGVDAFVQKEGKHAIVTLELF
jgi:hypothetical protein